MATIVLEETEQTQLFALNNVEMASKLIQKLVMTDLTMAWDASHLALESIQSLPVPIKQPQILTQSVSLNAWMALL